MSGRQHFYLDHEWMLEIGEGLPAFRPPLVTRDRPAGDAAASVTVRFLTPTRSGRSTPSVTDNDWIEAVNTNGVVAARALVSHRIPAGTVLMYHSQDRHLNVPLTQRDRLRGGSDNALTHISMKPTHMIGGYAQFAYGFNYYGPCGTQRDEVTTIRKRSVKVEY